MRFGMNGYPKNCRCDHHGELKLHLPPLILISDCEPCDARMIRLGLGLSVSLKGCCRAWVALT